MRKPCPQCRESQVTRMHRRGILDYLASLCCVYPYCCRACSQCFKALRLGTRFVPLASRRSNGSVKPPARRQDRRFQTSFTVVFSWRHTGGEGIVTEIGLGGCRLKTDVELTEKSPLKLKLQLPGSKPEVRVDAVVRTVENGSFGLCFSRFLGDEKKRLGQFLIQLLLTEAA